MGCSRSELRTAWDQTLLKESSEGQVMLKARSPTYHYLHDLEQTDSQPGPQFPHLQNEGVSPDNLQATFGI